MDFQPIGTQVLVEYEEGKQTHERIALPEATDTFDYSMFVVRRVGNGFLTTTGSFVTLPVKVGDRIKLRPSAKGNLVPLEPWLCDDRKLAVIDVSHIAGVWQGDLPEPKFKTNIVTPSVKDKANILVS